MTGRPDLVGDHLALDLFMRALVILVLALVILGLLPAIAQAAG